MLLEYKSPHVSTTNNTQANAKCDVVVVGCGNPKRSMGWYHSNQLLDGDVPSGRLTDIVEPFFLSDAGASASHKFSAFKESNEERIAFHASVDKLSYVPPSKKALACISARTSDNPALFRAVINKGFKNVMLEKPGATTVKELEDMSALAKSNNVRVFMGYNKNVSTYVAEARAFEA